MAHSPWATRRARSPLFRVTWESAVRWRLPGGGVSSVNFDTVDGIPIERLTGYSSAIDPSTALEEIPLQGSRSDAFQQTETTPVDGSAVARRSPAIRPSLGSFRLLASREANAQIRIFAARNRIYPASTFRLCIAPAGTFDRSDDIRWFT